MSSEASSALFNNLHFDNRFVRELPADPEPENYRRQVYQACYSRVLPTKMGEPTLVAYSSELAAELGLTEKICASLPFRQVFVGNQLLEGMEPYACCYGGHQFGYWAGQLGDGRAINLGEVVTRQGQYLTLQLKGAGLTPYSRSADGLAVLRSSIREFLCSEAMHYLGVPTTRALSVILTGKMVSRDMFYDGNPQMEPGAVVCRVAPSFTRFGSFQIFTDRDDLDTLKKLLDYTIRYDFPHLDPPSVKVYLQWFAEVCKLTAALVVHWQRVGFVHGVLNTDNMSILGLTIDYGPYGWIENYDPDWTPNTTDAQGRRYRFGNQPQIAYWNLVQLANALYPIIKRAEPLQQALANFQTDFE
ncbi:MAG: protein adenylyltransferase SelO family protein, partial [Methylomonas sp.]